MTALQKCSKCEKVSVGFGLHKYVLYRGHIPTSTRPYATPAPDMWRYCRMHLLRYKSPLTYDVEMLRLIRPQDLYEYTNMRSEEPDTCSCKRPAAMSRLRPRGFAGRAPARARPAPPF